MPDLNQIQYDGTDYDILAVKSEVTDLDDSTVFPFKLCVKDGRPAIKIYEEV